MKGIIERKFDSKEIIFEKFYYSLCKKKPQQELVFSRVEKWADVDDSLRNIFMEQLEFIIKSKLNKKNFRGTSTNTLLEINKKILLPDGIELPMDDVVLNIFQKIVADNHEDDVLKNLGNMLSLKYLTAKYSRPSIYGLFTFTIEDEGECHRFAFVTLCDLELNQQNLRVDENEQKLVMEILKNVFKEKKLTKGVLYPYIDTDAKEFNSILLYEDDKNPTLYWAEAFECNFRLSRSEEKEAIRLLLDEHLSENNSLTLERIGTFLEAVSVIPESSISHEHWASALEAVDSGITIEQLKSDWKEKLKSNELTLNKETIFSANRDYTLKMGEDIEIKVTPKVLKDIKQFTHNGKSYLVLKGNQSAKLDGVKSTIEEMSWELFKDIIDNE